MKSIITGVIILVTAFVISPTFGQLNETEATQNATWFSPPTPSKYLFGASAFMIAKGNGYYQNTYVLFNSVSYGLTDNISVGLGVEPLESFGPNGRPVGSLSFKTGVTLAPHLRIAAGGYFIQFLESGDLVPTGRFGIGYGVATFGSASTNISPGIGIITSEKTSAFYFSIAGQWRVAKYLMLVSDNALRFAEEPLLISYGAKVFGRRWALTVGGIFDGPYFDFVWTF